MWRLAGVPDEDATVVRRAGKDVVIYRANREAVYGVDVQEHVERFSPGTTTINHCLFSR